MKNDHHANDFKVSYKPGRDRITVFEQSFLLYFKRRKVVRQHFKSFLTQTECLASVGKDCVAEYSVCVCVCVCVCVTQWCLASVADLAVVLQGWVAEEETDPEKEHEALEDPQYGPVQERAPT